MSTPSIARSERQALCDLLDELGPEAPTLCEGWQTRDLAAHLAVRERRPDAAAGLIVPALSGYLGRVQQQMASRPYPEVVQSVRAGPPSWSPQRIDAVDRATNTLEYLVHHEDVRRARPGWNPRPPDAAREAEVWNRLRFLGKMQARSSPVGLVLEPPDAAPTTIKDGHPAVVMAGPPTEIALYLAGRSGQAQVELRGAPDTVERFRAATFRM